MCEPFPFQVSRSEGIIWDTYTAPQLTLPHLLKAINMAMAMCTIFLLLLLNKGKPCSLFYILTYMLHRTSDHPLPVGLPVLSGDCPSTAR